MPLFDQETLQESLKLVYTQMQPTPQYQWPQLSNRVGTEVWVKHENHTPTGAFKVRGGITLVHWLKKNHPTVHHLITATRGNHGQSQARAGIAQGLKVTIVVPHGNSTEKNAAMKAYGANIIEYGQDFDEARQEAQRLSQSANTFLVPSFHTALVTGVATYAWELLSSVPDLHTVYVSIGCGSGIAGLITVRDILGLKTRIVGVVSQKALAVKLSVESASLTSTDTADTFADGIAVRVPVPEAFDIYASGADRIISVSDDEIAEAMRIYYSDTHNIAEGAGAAPLAGLMKERSIMKNKKTAVILSGGNIDMKDFSSVLQGRTPVISE